MGREQRGLCVRKVELRRQRLCYTSTFHIDILVGGGTMLTFLNVRHLDWREEKRHGIRLDTNLTQTFDFSLLFKKEYTQTRQPVLGWPISGLVKGAFFFFVVSVHGLLAHRVSLHFTIYKIHREQILLLPSPCPLHMVLGTQTDSERQQHVALKLESKIQL